MTHIFILNPVAGKGYALQYIPLIHDYFALHPKEHYTIEQTKYAGHATEIAKHYSNYADTRLYILGGDGTVNEVINGISSKNIPIGIIPCGTGNDFILSLNPYPSTNLLETMVHGNKHHIDLGQVNGKYFINIGSIGFDAEVASNVNKFKHCRLISGKLAYIFSILYTVFRYKPTPLSITIDNKKMEEKAMLITASNGKSYGGGFFITPDADLSDGYFDICLVKSMNLFTLLRVFLKVRKGLHTQEKYAHLVTFYRGKKVSIRSLYDVAINIDGEILHSKEIAFELLPLCVTIITPDTAPNENYNYASSN